MPLGQAALNLLFRPDSLHFRRNTQMFGVRYPLLKGILMGISRSSTHLDSTRSIAVLNSFFLAVITTMRPLCVVTLVASAMEDS